MSDGDDNGEGSTVLMGVGTRSKKLGFLAHGGGGGAPVFMGVGYVDGAEEAEVEGADYGGGPGVKYDDGDSEGEEEEQNADVDDDEYCPLMMEARRPGASIAAVRCSSR